MRPKDASQPMRRSRRHSPNFAADEGCLYRRALKELDEIGDWLSDHYPAIAPAVERRIHNVIARIAQWPQSARRSAKYPGVRVVPVG
jgi:hypothetical protein